MEIGWMIIEIMAIVVENMAVVYFLYSRFPSVTTRDWVTPATFLMMVLGGLVCVTGDLTGLEVYSVTTLSVYLFFFRRGSVLQKLMYLFVATAVLVSTTLVGGLAAAAVNNASYTHGITQQNGQRLLALLLIKTMQIIIYYILSRPGVRLRRIRLGPSIALCVTLALNLACLLAVFVLANIPELTRTALTLLVCVAAGLMMMTFFIIILHELFLRSQVRNTELNTQLQRMELEQHYFSELQTMYNDMRIWRHEYRNNLMALQALVKAGDHDKTLKYIDKITALPQTVTAALQTGDPALDAVVSAKLAVAQKQGIRVDVQVIYPEQHGLETSDLCAIIGNLLDNAIEGCQRIDESERERFIDCAIQLQRRHLIISIRNSARRGLTRIGGRFLSSKTGHYHGIGLAYVDSIVEKNQGYVTRQVTDDSVFETTVMLPLYPKGLPMTVGGSG